MSSWINQQPTVLAGPLIPWLAVRFPADRPEAIFDDEKLKETGLAQYAYNGERRMTVYKADEVAGKLDMHPMEIWPEWGNLPHKEELNMHGMNSPELAEVIGVKAKTIRTWRRFGVWSNVNEWIAECLSPTCAQA